MAIKWVDLVNGSDSNAGTYDSPYLTSNKAITVASSGDTITFKTSVSATFTMSASVNAYNAGGMAKNLTFNSENNALIIDGQNLYRYSFIYFQDNFTYNFEGITFLRNKIVTANEALIGYVGGGESNVSVTVSRCQFLETTLAGNMVACVALANNHSPTGSTLIVENCNFSGNGAGGSTTSFVSMFRGSNTFIERGNVFYVKSGDTAPSAIFRFSGNLAVGSYVKNCIMENEGTAAMPMVAAVVENINFDYNNYYPAAKFNTLPSGTGNITTNPMLVSPLDYNFNLDPDSGARGTGVII